MSKKQLKIVAYILTAFLYGLILYLILFNAIISQEIYASMFIYIPKNLNLNNLLNRHPPKVSFKMEHLYYVLGQIRYIPFKSPKSMDNEGYVRINAQALANHIKQGSMILKYFVDEGVFDRKEYCSTQNRSRGYKFTEKYDKEFIGIDIHHKPYRPRKRTKKKFDPKSEKLKVFFNPSLIIDDAVFKWIDLFPDYYIKRGELKRFERNHHKYTVIKIQRGEFSEAHFDDTSGRFHSTMTSMKKECRNFLSYDGEGLTQIDLSQSQLFLSLRLFSSDFYSHEKAEMITIGDLKPKIQNNYKQYTTSHTPIPNYNTTTIHYSTTQPPSTMLGKPSVSLSGCLKSDFVSHVTTEGFYSQFKNQIQTSEGLKKLSKEDLKKIVFLIIYSPESIKYVNDDKIRLPLEAFKRCYPDVMALYNALKRGKEKDSHKFLPQLLQNIESILFLDRILPRFMKENKGIPIYSVHDCAIVPISFKSEIEKIVVEETEKAIGFKPCYTVEDLIPEKAFESVCTTIERFQYYLNTTNDK